MSKGYELKQKQFPIGTHAANSNAIVYALWTVPHAIKITAARLGVNAAVTAQDTDYNTIEIMNGLVSVASIANGPVAGGSTIAAGAFGAMVVATAAGANEVAAGSVLTLKSTKTGNGLAMTGVAIEISYYDYDS
jgi:hypothetical protein